MSDEDIRILQEPKMAMQIISKVLQGIDGKGFIFINGITIGKIVITSGPNGKDIQLSEISVDGEPLPQIGSEDQKNLPKQILGSKQVQATSVGGSEMRFPQGDYHKRTNPQDVPYYDLIERVIGGEDPACGDQLAKNYSCAVRQFFKFCCVKKGTFQLEDICQDDLISYLDDNLGIQKKRSIAFKKGMILRFFNECEKQGIRKAIPRFFYNYSKEKKEEGKNEPCEVPDFSFPV